MRRPGLLVILAMMLAASGDARGQSRPRSATWNVRTIETPAGPGSGEPNLTVTREGDVLLSWIEPAGDKSHALRYARRSRGSGSWSEARTIATGEGWFVNWADFPSVAALEDGTLFAHWLVRSGTNAHAYDVQVATSRDGRTWSRAVVPHRDGTQAEHGFVSMTPWGAREMGIVWLDGRKAETSLFHTTMDAHGRLGQETVLDPRVCDCCQTDMARAKDATVVVYRDRREKEVRDVSLVRFKEGRWSAPTPLGRDGWEIAGCPVNGPAVAARGARVAAAWFAAPAEKAQVKVSFSKDSGATFGAPVAVDEGRPLGRVDVVALADGAALVSWLEQADDGARLLVRRVFPDGTRDAPVTVASSAAARSSGFARMVESGGEVILAWRETAEPSKVRTAVLAALPAAR